MTLAAKPGSVGNKGLSGWTQFRIVDEEGNPTQAGEVGELCFKSPSAMRGYLSAAEEESPFRDGWLHTGDIVRQDEEGYVFFVDRKKDIIRRGGLNISSAEVENVLKLFPEVFDAAVISKSHPVLGEDVCAYVESDSGLSSEALREHCEAHLAGYKVPRHIRLWSASYHATRWVGSSKQSYEKDPSRVDRYLAPSPASYRTGIIIRAKFRRNFAYAHFLPDRWKEEHGGTYGV